MNENLEAEAMVLSKKIELATHFRLYQEDYASENYQIMNYGIAGKISPHIDYPGIIFDEKYKDYDGKFYILLNELPDFFKIVHLQIEGSD